MHIKNASRDKNLLDTCSFYAREINHTNQKEDKLLLYNLS